jgi:hypothetical protein
MSESSASPLLRRLSALFVALLLTAASRGLAQTWVPIGPEGGTISALVFAPSGGGVVYAATPGGGIFTSRDNGTSWRGPGVSLSGGGLTPAALAVDPQNSAVAYAAAVDGIWKTATGGDVWVRLPVSGLNPGVVGISILAVDPVHSQTVYAGSFEGVFKSDNGGRRWAARDVGLPEGARVHALAIDPSAPADLVASVFWGDSQVGLFRSLDGAATWTRLPGAPLVDVTRLVWVSPSLYALGSGMLYRSDDEGTSWTALPSGPGFLAIQSLAVDPAGTVYVGVGSGIEVSHDHEESFTFLGPLGPGKTVLSLAAGSGGAVLVGTEDFGVFRQVGATFVASNPGLTATAIRGVEVDPNDSGHLYAAVPGDGLVASRDRGRSWQPDHGDLSTVLPGHPAALEPQALALALNAPSRLFLAILQGVAASTDDGLSWSYAAITGCTTPDFLAVDPRGRDLYTDYPVSGTCGFRACHALASHDSGKTWSCLSKISRLHAVLVDPTNAATVYLAGDSTLYKSVDGGKSFALASSGLEPNAVLALAASPAAPRVIYAGVLGGGVWKSRDGAAHWAPAGGPGLPGASVVALVVDPVDAQRVYAGIRGFGVFVSQNGGASWQPLGVGLPGESFIGPLRLGGSGPHTLYAGTDGAGIWALPVP